MNKILADTPDRHFLSVEEFKYSGNLYKYMSNLEYIKSAIKTKTIFLSNPSSFNDPFDGGFILTNDSVGKIFCKPNTLKRILEPHLKKEQLQRLNNLIKKGIFMDSIDNLIEKIYTSEECASAKTLIYMILLTQNGLGTKEKYPKPKFDPKLRIFCFSKKRNSFPMWAHYANNYKGVCLEYDAKDVKLTEECDIPDYALNTVQYTDAYRTDEIESYEHFFYKSNQWEYEEEVRIVCNTYDNILKFPYLKRVYLGSNMPYKEKMELAAFCFENEIDAFDVETSIDGSYDLSFVSGGDLMQLGKEKGYLDKNYHRKTK